MSWVRRWGREIVRLQDAAKRELLRDPTVILFERAPEPVGQPRQDAAGGR